MMIDCDKNMIVALLKNWRPNRLRAEYFRLSRDRPRLLNKQNGVCAICRKELSDNGNDTHIDHIKTANEVADKVLKGKLTFDEAYSKFWEDSNIRAVCRLCNLGRNKKKKVAVT